MSLWQYDIAFRALKTTSMLIASSSFKSLNPQTRILVGLGVVAWGTIGLYMTPAAERKLGFEPSEKDKQALEAAKPKIIFVDREK